MSADGSWYARNWPRLGVVLGGVLAGAAAVSGDRLTRLQRLVAYNAAALTAHQFEEYVWPAPNFAAFHNKVVMGSTEPDRPLNVVTAKTMNVNYAYPFYLLPVVFPEVRPLGMAPSILGLAQSLIHLLRYPIQTRTPYVSGAATAVLLHLPLGVAWFKEASRDRPFTKAEIAAGAAYFVAFAGLGLGRPNLRLRAQYAAAHAG